MALQVWLPLNGDLHNQGLSNQTINITTTPIWSATSKIGSQALYTKTRMTTMNFPGLIGVSIYSVAYWLYIPTAIEPTAWSDMFGIQFNCGGTNIWERDERRAATTVGRHNYHLAKSGSEGNNTNAYYGTKEDDSANNNWIHVTLVKNDINARLYFNTTLQATITNSNFENSPREMTGAVYLGDNGCEAYLQDFRIYDHALSIKEIEEISKGLILHYKLDNNGIYNENILTNSTGLQGTMNWSGVISTGIENGQNYLIVKRTDTTSTSRTFITHSAITSLVNSWNPGDQFTISGYYKIPSTETYEAGGNLFIRWTYTTSASNYMDTGFTTPLNAQKDVWIRFENTYTVPSSYQNGAVNFYLSAFAAQKISTVYWKQVKLEKGNKATVWTPAKTDDSYFALSNENNIIYDSSGYSNQGSIVGSIEISNETPRYNASTYIKSSDPTTNSTTGEYYIIGNISLIAPTAITISWWAKPENGYGGTINHAMWSTTANDISSDYQVSAFNHRDAGFDINSSDGVHLRLSTSSFVKNEWHHYVVVYNGQTAYLYKDGIQQTSVAFSTAKTLGNFTKILIGHSRAGGVHRKMLGKYSDFRIYCTALTDKQIKELYDTSATVDKDGNIYVREVIE